MCFSSGASFSAGAILAVIGTASIRQVQQPSQLPFASIPFLFSIQQIAEGILWVSLPDPSAYAAQHIATYVFLSFAQVIWPMLVPLSILLLERKSKHKPVLKIFTGIGMVVSGYLLYCLFTFHVEAKIIGYHISYIQDYPMVLRNFGAVLYIIATIGPLLFSQVKRMWILGLTIFASYIVTELFYNHSVISVWCFFASLISIAVFLIIRDMKLHPPYAIIRHRLAW